MNGSQPAISVFWTTGDMFIVDVRAHFLTVDQPFASGGKDLGPTPTELFVASLGACVGTYAAGYMRRHDIDVGGLRVDCTFDMAEDPVRVGRILVRLSLPPGFPDNRRAALAAVVRHCTVHNSMLQPPEVDMEMDLAASVA